MLLKLKPNSLGDLKLKISIQRDVVVAEFNVESQVVKEALESNLEDLRNALSDKGFNVHELNVSVNQDQKDQSQQQFGQRHQMRRIAGIETGIEESYMPSLEGVGSESTIDTLG